jgi:hypothetical protein
MYCLTEVLTIVHVVTPIKGALAVAGISLVVIVSFYDLKKKKGIWG